MASQKAVAAVLYFMFASVIVYVLYATFGRSMDMMRSRFTAIAPNITMSAGWHTVATTQLATWDVFFNAGIIILIAIGVWAVKITFIDTRYDRPGG